MNIWKNCSQQSVTSWKWRPSFRKWILITNGFVSNKVHNSDFSFTVIYYAWKAKSGYPTTFGQTTPKYNSSSKIEATTTASTSSGKYFGLTVPDWSVFLCWVGSDLPDPKSGQVELALRGSDTITYKFRITQKKLHKKPMLFLASMGETGLTHDIFFLIITWAFWGHWGRRRLPSEGGQFSGLKKIYYKKYFSFPILTWAFHSDLERPKWEFKIKRHGLIPFLP